MFITRFTRRGPEVRFEADKGGAAGAGGDGSESPVGTQVAAAAPVKTSEHSAEFLSLIPGGNLLLPKEEAPVLEEEAKTDDLPDPDAPPKKPEDEDEVPEAELKKPYVQKMQKRIGKITAQREQLREELDEAKTERETLKQQLAEAQTAKPAAPNPNPLASIMSGKKLEEAVEHAEEVRAWALKNRDGATIKDPNAPNGERDISAEEMTNIFLLHDDILRKHAPAQRNYLNALNDQTAKAEIKFPWLKDPKSEEYQLRGQVLTAMPELRRFPDFENFIGLWVRAYMADKAEAAAPAVIPAKPIAKLAPTPPAAVGSPTPKASSSKPKQQAALAAIQKNPGSVEALESYFR